MGVSHNFQLELVVSDCFRKFAIFMLDGGDDLSFLEASRYFYILCLQSRGVGRV